MNVMLSWLVENLNRVIPECLFKKELRGWLCRIRPGIIMEIVVTRGECIVQVGTPYTRTVDKLAKLVGSAGRVLVIEAEPDNACRLSEHVRHKQGHNITIICKGAWSERGKHNLILARNPLDNRVEDKEVLHDNDLVEGAYVGSQQIDIDTVDHMMEESGVDSVDFMAITVNGAELHVLRGMERMLKRTQRLFVKGHAISKESKAPLNQSIGDFLRGRGFRAVITKGSGSVVEEFGERTGDVFAWR